MFAAAESVADYVGQDITSAVRDCFVCDTHHYGDMAIYNLRD